MPETRRLLEAMAVLLAYVAFCAFVSLRRRQRRVQNLSPVLLDAQSRGQSLLIAYASQTGFAEDLARRSATTLQTGAAAVQLRPLDALNVATLSATRRAMFLVSTTGEGDAPDSAAQFVRKVMDRTVDLTGLDYGLLALGDSSYIHYCAFGRQLDAWLQRCGATPLFNRVEVDDGEGCALQQWHSNLRHLASTAEFSESDAIDWTSPNYQPWRLAERYLLNPGSPGGAIFQLVLKPLQEQPSWSSGDIAEVSPRNSLAVVRHFLQRLGLAPDTTMVGGAMLGELLCSRILPPDGVELEALQGLQPQTVLSRLKAVPHRAYSIASLASEGRLELLVRQMCHTDGRLGLGSGWLTKHAPLDGSIALRIRTNRRFHLPTTDRPLILIGNGTGLAGLRGHLKARQAAGHRRNWLIFGERTRVHDFLFQEEIKNWVESKHLQRLDLAFSRDQDTPIYVQNRLREASTELTSWVADGAAIYVCGSMEGMSTGVHTALGDVLGLDTLERLMNVGLYRRDVY